MSLRAGPLLAVVDNAIVRAGDFVNLTSLRNLNPLTLFRLRASFFGVVNLNNVDR